MIDLVRDLAQFVTRTARSAEELTAHLGIARPSADQTQERTEPGGPLAEIDRRDTSAVTLRIDPPGVR